MALLSKFLIPKDFGYVILVGLGHGVLNAYLAYKVVKARKTYSIEYPTMYSPDNKVFNCIQRVHQNTLEQLPTFLFTLVFSGLQYPKITTATGVTYLIARVLYSRGYSSGEPEKRKVGAILSHVAEIVLFGGALSFAWHQLGFRPCHSKWSSH